MDLAPSSVTVDVWRVPLDQPGSVVEALRSDLSEDERARADRAATPAMGAHFTVGRGVLRSLLARYVGACPAELELGYAPQGKPLLLGHDLPFNVAHSHGLALVAIAPGRAVGVDLERVRELPAATAIAERFFSEAERTRLAALPPAARMAQFLRLWTRKEAYLKATGGGLGWGRALASVDADRDAIDDWQLCDLDVDEQHAAALAAEGSAWTLRTFTWEQPT